MHHFTNVQCRFNSHTFCCLEGQSEISPLVLVVEFVVGDVCRQIGVKYGTESEPIIPAAAEVGDVNVLITLSLLLAPPEQSIPLGSSIFPG